jgi:hypothetical protein
MCLWSLSLNTLADGFDYKSSTHQWGGNDEDTILVEDVIKQKISYSRAIKAACKNLLGFDIDKYFSGGKNKRSEVIRQLDDLAERSHYHLRLDQEEITFKFTLNL